jgi:hypothetical protein
MHMHALGGGMLPGQGQHGRRGIHAGADMTGGGEREQHAPAAAGQFEHARRAIGFGGFPGGLL